MDDLIIGAILAIVGATFFSGVTKGTSAIIAISFASIFAAALSRPLINAVAGGVAMIKRTGEGALFLLLVAVFTGVSTTTISRWLGGLRLPRRIAILDNLGGAALRVVSGLAVTLATLVLAIMLLALNQPADVAAQANTLGFLRSQIRHSALFPSFVRILAPWRLGGLPPLLDLVE